MQSAFNSIYTKEAEKQVCFSASLVSYILQHETPVLHLVARELSGAANCSWQGIVSANIMEAIYTMNPVGQFTNAQEGEKVEIYSEHHVAKHPIYFSIMFMPTYGQWNYVNYKNYSWHDSVVTRDMWGVDLSYCNYENALEFIMDRNWCR